MTGKKAMQALLDGKTLRKDGVVITPAEWGLLMKFDDGTCRKIVLEDCEVVEEYPLDFEQALRAMLDGKIVENNYKFGRYRFDKGFEYSNICDWQPCIIDVILQNYKWKVVE